MPKYRIVKDRFAGFEVQRKSYWLTAWEQVGFVNTFDSIVKAKEFIEKLKASGEVVHID